MAFDSALYQAVSDLTLWFKYRSGDDMVLSDVSKIIPLRWTYFKENWEFIRQDLEERISSYSDSNYLDSQIDSMDDFIESQRNSVKKINPFATQDVFFKFYGIFDNILINSIELNNEEEKLITAAINRVSLFNKNDFLKIREKLEEARDILADEVGLTDEDYNRVYHRSAVPKQVDPTISSIARMNVLQSTITSVNFVLANIFSLEVSFVDPFALARQNANNPDINIGQYKSGRLVRMNYGEDLQLLALRTLGDHEKWIDIAIANGLKPPYIDEVGQPLSLISNGDENQINISGTDLDGELNIDKFFINQVIFLQSDTQKFPEQRIILNITEIPVSGEIVIELSGTPDLDRYKINENAYMRVFKPNTVNSNFFILIPSAEELPDNIEKDVPFFLATATESEKNAKVDLALNDSGELLFNSTGDLQMSFGLANAIQAIKLKLVVELGMSRRHPEYGLVNIVGSTSQNRQDLRALLIDSIDEQVRQDPRFERIESIDADYVLTDGTGNGVAVFVVRMEVRLVGGDRPIPISFTVKA